jgi:hypothetical protein
MKSRLAGGVAVFALGIPLAAGCASSNANKASRDFAGTLRFSETREVAVELAEDILKSPRYQRFRALATDRGEEVTIALLEPVKVDGDDFTGDFRRKIDELFDAVPEVFLQRDVGEFRRVNLAGGDPDAVLRSKLDVFDNQDTSPEFNQRTGDVTTGGKAKAVLAMEVIGKRDRVAKRSGGFEYDYVLRVKISDLVRKTDIYSGSVQLNK